MNEQRQRALRARQQADCVIPAPVIQAAYRQLARQIDAAMGAADPVLLVVMNGGLVPAAGILAHLRSAVTVDYLHATRYREQTAGGRLEWRVPPPSNLRGRSVVIVDDILDEGYTLAAIQQALQACGAAEVRTAVLADKQHDRRCPQARADWVGVTVPDRYVFGCGMDLHGYFRQLPAIYAVAEAD
ncbi:MAG: hypoxanthine-guanine phosphoribosyltransferase [Pseudomonadota bacterium]|nr:hypoxanthine-guanine phosphoribosyltransferase [Pseudomonadota bacterium]